MRIILFCVSECEMSQLCVSHVQCVTLARPELEFLTCKEKPSLCMEQDCELFTNKKGGASKVCFHFVNDLLP